MGIKISTLPSPAYVNFRLEDWIVTHSNSPNDSQFTGNFLVFQNKHTFECIDRHYLCFDSQQQYQSYVQVFRERIKEEQIVKGVHLEPLINKDLCSETYQAYVYIQHIPVRLSDISDIPFIESLYILRCVLMGCEKLYRKIGYFQLFEQQICIDQQGKARVWINSNLSKHQPMGFRDTLSTIYQQRTLCKEILYLIFDNTETATTEEQKYLPFIEYTQIQSSMAPTFKEALFFLDKYTKQYQIQLPIFCESIVKIFQQEYGSEMFALAPESQNQSEYRINQDLFYSSGNVGEYPLEMISQCNGFQSSDHHLEAYQSDRSKKLSLKSRSKVQRNSIISNLKLSNRSNSFFMDKTEDNKNRTKSRSNSISSDPNETYHKKMPFRDSIQSNQQFSNSAFETKNQEKRHEPSILLLESHHKSSMSNFLQNSRRSTQSRPPKVNFTYSNTRSNTKLVSFAGFEQIDAQKSDSYPSHENNNNKQNMGGFGQFQRKQRRISSQVDSFDQLKLKQALSVIEEEQIDPQIMADLIRFRGNNSYDFNNY